MHEFNCETIIETEVGYVAGLFDGEGHITCFRKEEQGRPQVIVGITNTVKACLEKVQFLYGGKIHGRDRTKDNPNAKYVYQWSVRGHEAAMFLWTIREIVIIKKEKVLAAMKILNILNRGTKLGFQSQLILELELEKFGSLIYYDDREKIKLICVMCNTSYYRSKDRSITCSPSCRKKMSDAVRNGKLNLAELRANKQTI